MTWTTPVFDRTMSDVEYIKNIKDRISELGWNGITEDERMFWLNGYYYGEQLVDTSDSLSVVTSDLESVAVLLQYGDGVIRGVINPSDLNRIESNTEYLNNLLIDYGYTTTTLVTKTDWDYYDYLYLDELDRIRNNVIFLRDAYFSVYTNPLIDVGNDVIDITDVNNIEELLWNLNETLLRMIADFKYTGTFACGQSFILPQEEV